jgi:phosphotransferase system HPr (HPr) family protein
MRSIETTVRNPSGIHARPGALFVRTAAGFGSRITLENLDRGTAPVDAKSILSVMQAGVGRGQRIRLTAEGEDEETALAALDALIRDGLGEAIPEG